MDALELTFLRAKGVFEGIVGFLGQAVANGLSLDQVERQLKTDLATAGREFLQEFVEASGDGDQGETVSGNGRVLNRSETPQSRRYVSIFGDIEICRFVYSEGSKKAIEFAPLDARLGLPAGEISYVLEDFQQRLSVQGPYGKSTADLKEILGTGVAVGTAERMTRELGSFAEGFRLLALTDEETPVPEAEADILVVAADGKGVVMRKTLAEQLKEEKQAAAAAAHGSADGTSSVSDAAQPTAGAGHCSPGAGTSEETSRKRQRRKTRRKERKRRAAACRRQKARHARKKPNEPSPDSVKKSRKQMAYVGAVYTIAPFVRTPDQILNEVSRRERAKDRPRPQNKHVWGEMTDLQQGQLLDGRTKLFIQLAVECHLRDPQHQKPLVCLMDGEEPLWLAQEEWLQPAVEILDIFHVFEHLEEMKRSLPDRCPAGDFVEHHARMLLKGKVDYVIRSLGCLIKKWNLHGAARSKLQAGIGYFRSNRDRMHYDDYLARGYPIGSGVAEGTCRNLVKDRMERTGMRWDRGNAQAMIQLRALYLNDEWHRFIAYRIKKERARLYGNYGIYSSTASYAQAI